MSYFLEDKVIYLLQSDKRGFLEALGINPVEDSFVKKGHFLVPDDGKNYNHIVCLELMPPDLLYVAVMNRKPMNYGNMITKDLLEIGADSPEIQVIQHYLDKKVDFTLKMNPNGFLYESDNQDNIVEFRAKDNKKLLNKLGILPRRK